MCRMGWNFYWWYFICRLSGPSPSVNQIDYRFRSFTGVYWIIVVNWVCHQVGYLSRLTGGQARKKHIVTLPYTKDFNENGIPTKDRSIQMSAELVEYCKKEIHDLLAKQLIRPSKPPWSCLAFYI
ncbi:hypothetical protein Ddye_025505 [Dipteronia dyeriana]|uniref:Uncharacterized protein n=1 Tax=Dipteronia dyeriana TaxID=168575 RepID=A0AAD9WPN4_9ROSI|nr:hypothetical protein Ddye_025505 [Dipteronia dyeriana]